MRDYRFRIYADIYWGGSAQYKHLFSPDAQCGADPINYLALQFNVFGLRSQIGQIVYLTIRLVWSERLHWTYRAAAPVGTGEKT